MPGPVDPDFYDPIATLNASMAEVGETMRRRNNPAEWMHTRLMRMISVFERRLDSDHVLGAIVTSGPRDAFYVDLISFSNPDLLILSGKDANGSPVQLVQHHSQMNIVLVSLRKVEPEARRIGFVHPTAA